MAGLQAKCAEDTGLPAGQHGLARPGPRTADPVPARTVIRANGI
jgi:hypothetical protein